MQRIVRRARGRLAAEQHRHRLRGARDEHLLERLQRVDDVVLAVRRQGRFALEPEHLPPRREIIDLPGRRIFRGRSGEQALARRRRGAPKRERVAEARVAIRRIAQIGLAVRLRGRVREAGRAPFENLHPAGVLPVVAEIRVVLARRADGEIVDPVAIEIARRQRPAEKIVRLVESAGTAAERVVLLDDRGKRRIPRGISARDQHAPGVVEHPGNPDRQIFRAVSIAIKIAHRETETEQTVRLVKIAGRRDVPMLHRAGVQPRRGARHDMHGAGVVDDANIRIRRADDEFLVNSGANVPDRHRRTEARIRLRRHADVRGIERERLIRIHARGIAKDHIHRARPAVFPRRTDGEIRESIRRQMPRRQRRAEAVVRLDDGAERRLAQRNRRRRKPARAAEINEHHPRARLAADRRRRQADREIVVGIVVEISDRQRVAHLRRARIRIAAIRRQEHARTEPRHAKGRAIIHAHRAALIRRSPDLLERRTRRHVIESVPIEIPASHRPAEKIPRFQRPAAFPPLADEGELRGGQDGK